MCKRLAYKLAKRNLAKDRLRLADAEHELSLWGSHFGTRPSERTHMRQRIERIGARINKLEDAIAIYEERH